jgi:ribose 5-phosphate isomerase B
MLAADHAGFALKADLLTWIEAKGYEVVDLGAYSVEPEDDYPDVAEKAALYVANGKAERGIIVCGSGVGASIVSNKIHGIRAAVCHDVYSARQGVEHDDMNILCLGARVVMPELARELTHEFLSATFSDEERHIRRLNKIIAIDDYPSKNFLDIQKGR